VIDALSATDFLYEVGSGLVVPKLDEELQGKRPGDILKFNDALPERFGERAGEEIGFQVLVKETKQRILPSRATNGSPTSPNSTPSTSSAPTSPGVWSSWARCRPAWPSARRCSRRWRRRSTSTFPTCSCATRWSVDSTT